MKGFSGFPEGKQRLTQVPNLFFSELLPAIDDLIELKITLYAFWAFGQKEGTIRYLQLADFLNDERFMSGIAPTAEDAIVAVEDGIERAVARGTLLHVTVEGASGSVSLFFLNSPRGRAAVEGITKGEWRPYPDDNQPISLTVERPNIFVLYEQNIGALTPLMADQLRDAEQSYPLDWIIDAINIAVANNVRKWRYVQSILERWQQEGKSIGISSRDSQKERRQQVPEEYRGIVKQ